MRGSLWSVVVLAVLGGIFARAISQAKPSSPASSTQATADVLGVFSPILALGLMLVAIGAAWVIAGHQGF